MSVLPLDHDESALLYASLTAISARARCKDGGRAWRTLAGRRIAPIWRRALSGVVLFVTLACGQAMDEGQHAPRAEPTRDGDSHSVTQSLETTGSSSFALATRDQPTARANVENEPMRAAESTGDVRQLADPEDRDSRAAPTQPERKRSLLDAGRVPGRAPEDPPIVPSPHRVIVERPTVVGQLDPAIVQRVVRSHVRHARSCYEKQAKREPSLEGRIVVQLTISAEGRVSKVAVAESSFTRDVIANCVTKQMATWRFPSPDAGIVIVKQGYRFSPNSLE